MPDLAAAHEGDTRTAGLIAHYDLRMGAPSDATYVRAADAVLAVGDAVHRAIASWPGGVVISDLLQRHRDVDWYAAGGVIRDILLGESDPAKDFDFFLGGAGIARVLAELETHGDLATGPFGSPRWTPSRGGSPADVIPISGFFNGLWPCRDMVDALNQFDFTANAIALDLRSGRLLDPQNGRRDAEERVLRAVRFDYPDEPIVPGNELSRHAVLGFRFLHYAAAKRLNIEPLTLSWLRSRRERFTNSVPFSTAFFPLHPRAFDPLEVDEQ